MRARIPVVRGLFALNEEISVLTRLCGGAGRTRTTDQTIITPALSIEHSGAVAPLSLVPKPKFRMMV
jgi:hypothetical protein